MAIPPEVAEKLIAEARAARAGEGESRAYWDRIKHRREEK